MNLNESRIHSISCWTELTNSLVTHEKKNSSTVRKAAASSKHAAVHKLKPPPISVSLLEAGEGQAKCRLSFRPLSCTCPCNTSTATETYCLPDMQQTTERRWLVLKQGFDCKQMFSNMSIDTGIRTVIRISFNINIIVFVEGWNWTVNHNCIFKDLI
jgi:hypothetical protein